MNHLRGFKAGWRYAEVRNAHIRVSLISRTLSAWLENMSALQIGKNQKASLTICECPY